MEQSIFRRFIAIVDLERYRDAFVIVFTIVRQNSSNSKL